MTATKQDTAKRHRARVELGALDYSEDYIDRFDLDGKLAVHLAVVDGEVVVPDADGGARTMPGRGGHPVPYPVDRLVRDLRSAGKWKW